MSAVTVQTFTSLTGVSWSKPSGAIFFKLMAIGAGGGGFSGTVTATSTLGNGGQGGGGGSLSIAYYKPSELPGSLTITCGTGGTGGTGNGITGANGTDSSAVDGVGVFYICGRGALSTAAGGVISTINVPNGLALYFGSTGGASGSGPSTTIVSNSLGRANGGGGGGGITTGNVASAGFSITPYPSANASPLMPGSGGSGGAASTTVNGSNGSDGNFPSGGGGGGGAARTGHTSGNGGKGGDGLVVIVSYF